MNGRIGAASLFFIASIAATTGVGAQEETGFYIGANFGFTSIDAGNTEQDVRNSLQGLGFSSINVAFDESSTGFKILGGYQINPNVAVEGYYANLGTYDLSVSTTGPVVSGGGELKLTGVGIDVLGMIPFGGSLSGFGRVGVIRWESEFDFSATGPGGTSGSSGSDDGTELKFGLGVQWRLSPRLRIRAEWEYYNFEESLNMLSLGLAYRF